MTFDVAREHDFRRAVVKHAIRCRCGRRQRARCASGRRLGGRPDDGSRQRVRLQIRFVRIEHRATVAANTVCRRCRRRRRRRRCASDWHGAIRFGDKLVRVRAELLRAASRRRQQRRRLRVHR